MSHLCPRTPRAAGELSDTYPWHSQKQRQMVPESGSCTAGLATRAARPSETGRAAGMCAHRSSASPHSPFIQKAAGGVSPDTQQSRALQRYLPG